MEETVGFHLTPQLSPTNKNSRVISRAGTTKKERAADSSTAGLPISETHTKNQFRKQPEGLRQFRDHRWKALGEKNSGLSGQFLFRQYFEDYIE